MRVERAAHYENPLEVERAVHEESPIVDERPEPFQKRDGSFLS